jgi:glutamine cyclotransferase
LAILVLAGSDPTRTFAGEPSLSSPVQTAERALAPRPLTVEVVSTYPHDSTAFTQGLLFHQGDLYESTGLYGKSTLRRVDLQTGNIFRRVALPKNLFGEGLALVGNRLVQLTWQERLALVYDVYRFERVGQFSYDGDGWGLCYDGKRLIQSDGSQWLTFRDPDTFAVTGKIDVRANGRPQTRINELECVDGAVYANVWSTDKILEIDPDSGSVRAVIDASHLLSDGERKALGLEAVLNGIAYDPTTKTFFLTGKLWPKLFRVRFVAADRP